MKRIIGLLLILGFVGMTCVSCSHKTYYPKKKHKKSGGGCGCGSFGYSAEKTAVYE